MNAEAFIRREAEALVARDAHTVLLYGSHADGSASEQSDYDLAGFGGVTSTIRDTRLVEGSYLDAFVYPDSVLTEPTPDHLKLRGGKVIVQRGALGTSFLQRLDDLHRQGPGPLAPDEAAARKAWAYKMAQRAERLDAEGNYRRVWLLTALLEDYFSLRGMWFEGPKKALCWLSQFDKQAFTAFGVALTPGADLSAIATLIPLVVGAQDA